MRKGIILLIVTVLLVPAAASADPLTLLPDLEGTLCWPEDASPETAVFVYTYRFPQVAGEGETEETINKAYQDALEYAVDFDVARRGEEILDTSVQSRTDVTYRVTGNDDAFFSVLLISDSTLEGTRIVNVSALVFSRDTQKAGNIMTLPYLLGILEDTSNDDWMRDHQTERAEAVVRELVWDGLERRREAGDAIPEWLTEESLADVFFPEEDFYYDGETGEIVFFLQPWLNSEEMEPDSFYTFSFDIEDIIDEM